MSVYPARSFPVEVHPWQNRLGLIAVSITVAVSIVAGVLSVWGIWELSSLIWFRIALALSFLWMLRNTDLLNYYDPVVAFYWYFMLSTVLGTNLGLQNWFSGFSISSATLLALGVSLWAFLFGARLAKAVQTRQLRQSAASMGAQVRLRSRRFEVYLDNQAVAITGLGLFLFGAGMSIMIFRFLFGVVPLFGNDAENLRVTIKAGLGYLVLPATFSLELGALLFFTSQLIGRRRGWILGAVVVLVAAGVELGFGTRMPPMALVLEAFVIFSFVRYGRLRVLLMAVIAVLLFAVLGLTSIVRYGLGTEWYTPQVMVGNAVWRIGMSDLRNLEMLMRVFPTHIDFLHGKTFLVDFLAILPGPDENSGMLLKNMLGLGFRGGGIVPMLAGELYINFGWGGVLVGSLFLGYFLRWFGYAFARRRRYSVFYLVLITQLVFQLASTYSGMLGSELFLWTLPTVVLWLVAKAVSHVIAKLGARGGVYKSVEGQTSEVYTAVLSANGTG